MMCVSGLFIHPGCPNGRWCTFLTTCLQIRAANANEQARGKGEALLHLFEWRPFGCPSHSSYVYCVPIESSHSHFCADIKIKLTERMWHLAEWVESFCETKTPHSAHSPFLSVSAVRDALLGHKISPNIRAQAEKPITLGGKINRKQSGNGNPRWSVAGGYFWSVTWLQNTLYVVMFCFVFCQKFWLPVGLHSNCSISPTASGTCQKCFTKYRNWGDETQCSFPSIVYLSCQ